ncbi:AAA family ATPase [Mycoplasmopsis alligatoris]|uniref:ATPase, AAA family n=1 Tax=Mycoplasmopsis alligatoris A21JP2 TaxID=747682 RepID=D4XWI4_9BACT|nr:AAA family ATPase [Mycoplasmopsis alligatoris]EFF41173.1 ATPase, AAA family [Mycoplasmopsis alligatoris A21JP2]
MKKKNIIGLIRYHVENNDVAFKTEAEQIARYFYDTGDLELSEYILSLIHELSLWTTNEFNHELQFLKKITVKNDDILNFPTPILDDLKGIVNAIKNDLDINKFLFEGSPGTGKTEAAKRLSKLLAYDLFVVNFEKLIDSKLGQTSKNIADLFNEIKVLSSDKKIIVLFDEIDALALNKIDSKDIREMGRATSIFLKELDELEGYNKNIIIIGTTNLLMNFDKALIRRFDAVVNFDRYEKEDLIEIFELYLHKFIKKMNNLPKDSRLLKKILNLSIKMPNPGDLKNIVKTSVGFSDPKIQYNYIQRIYTNLISDIKNKDIQSLKIEGFTLREIEKLKNKSKSSVARILDRENLYE